MGNFGFANAQRSFDGADANYGTGNWNVTVMAARADQGVFNMNGNPELNVDVQYLAVSQSALSQHLLWRAFAIGYHDGRTGLTKTDNRTLALRQEDHKNIRIGTYGGDLLATFPAGRGKFDFLLWGAFQNGRRANRATARVPTGAEQGRLRTIVTPVSIVAASVARLSIRHTPRPPKELYDPSRELNHSLPRACSMIGWVFAKKICSHERGRAARSRIRAHIVSTKEGMLT